MTKRRPLVSRDGLPSVAAALEAQEAARLDAVTVSAGTALGWARRNDVKLPTRGRCAAINHARLEAGLPPFVIDLRLPDAVLPPLKSKRDAIVLKRERSKQPSYTARQA